MSLFFSLQAISAVVLAIVIVPFLIVREIFKPLHRRKGPDGKAWKMPPGPPGVPIFGNLFQWRHARRTPPDFMAYLKNLARHGEMTTMSMGSKTWVLLNTSRVVQEIISKRGSITHERPILPVSMGLVSYNKRSVLRRTGPWSEGRRAMHYLLNGTFLKTYGEWQEVESTQLLANYLYRPGRWYSHHYRFSSSIMNRIVLGDSLTKSTPELDDLQRVTNEFLRTINTSFVDFFPLLDKLPHFLQPWRKYWEKMGKDHYDVFVCWWRPVKQAISNGTAPASFARDTLLHPDTKYTGDDEDAMYLALSVISAGSDNARMTLNTFVMAALCYPAAFQKAREEADKVCGANAERLPRIQDMPNMPYTCALVKEVLRWRPPVPMVPQHQSVQDIEFEGYRFPAGTEFAINAMAVCNDCESPEEFKPERWLDGNESSVTHGLWEFGGGRRICAGYKLAQTELFVSFARLSYCFDYAAAGSYNSYELRPNTLDEPFPVKVTVRGPEHDTLITNEAVKGGFLESAKVEF